MMLLGSEDEILVGNAALCLGNCMEVPQVASSLLKTDILQVLLKLAARDVGEKAVPLNAGIALGKLCTAEPRCVGPLVMFQNEQAPAWLGSAPGALVPSLQTGLGPSSCLLEEAFPEGTGGPQAPPREGRLLSDRDSLSAVVLSGSTPSFSILLFPLLLPLPVTISPLSLLLSPLLFQKEFALPSFLSAQGMSIWEKVQCP